MMLSTLAAFAETPFTVPPAYAASLIIQKDFAPVTVAAGSNYGTVTVKIDVKDVCTMYQLSDLSGAWIEPAAPSVDVTTP